MYQHKHLCNVQYADCHALSIRTLYARHCCAGNAEQIQLGFLAWCGIYTKLWLL